MGRSIARLRRRWRASWPWVVVAAAVYAGYFGAAAAAMAAYSDTSVGETVTGSVLGWGFVGSLCVVGTYVGTRLVDYFQPNFEPGRPRDEYLATTIHWFNDEE